jgi:C1A family cysteine protease
MAYDSVIDLKRGRRLQNAANLFNLKPDTPDARDWMFDDKLSAVIPAKLPKSVDLRSQMPAVVDQGNLGSCTANAIAGAFQYSQIKQQIEVFPPSRLFVYYNERLLEGTVNQDAGAYIRDGIKTLKTYGVCPETLWPYIISQFKVKPSDAAYTQAQLHTALSYYRVNTTATDVKTALAAGFPVIVGFTVYNSFLSYATSLTGIMQMPKPRERILGGHAVLIVGYNDAKQQFIVRNSWGTSWGVKGHFFMPYAYVTPSLTSDFWAVQTVN